MSRANCVACRSADDEINERHVCPHCNGFAYFLRFPRDLRLQVVDELYNDPEDLEFLKTLNLPEDIPTMEKCLNALGNQTPYTTVQRALAWRLIELRKNQKGEADRSTKIRADIYISIEEVKQLQKNYMKMMESAISEYEL
jgi:hypothetical protein